MSAAPEKIPLRVVIFTQDIRNITGLSEFSCRRLMRKIRKIFGKPPGSMISVAEFCACTGLEEEYVRPFLK